MKVVYFLIISLTLFSCSSETNSTTESVNNELKKDLLIKIESIEKISQTNSISKEEQQELIDYLLEFYHNFPEDKNAPVCLDKVQMVYSAMENYRKASLYADTLILKYPSYPNRDLIIESQAANYDIFIIPRDTVKVRHYYELLLKEGKIIDKNKKSDIQKRLSNLHLNFQEYCSIQNLE